MLQLHSLRIKSASTTATQRTQHFQRQFETLPLKKCVFGEGADWAFRNEESQNQIPQKWKTLAVGLAALVWIYNWIDSIPELSH